MEVSSLLLRFEKTSLSVWASMSLGLLVGRFGDFLREQPVVPTEIGPEHNFPMQLERLRGQFGHDMILLTMLSRADGEAAPQERQVILDFCLERARKAASPRPQAKPPTSAIICAT